MPFLIVLYPFDSMTYMHHTHRWIYHNIDTRCMACSQPHMYQLRILKMLNVNSINKLTNFHTSNTKNFVQFPFVFYI